MRIALAQAAARPADAAAARRADEPPRSRRAQLARGVPRRRIRTPVILVSHDRFFLDAVVTRIAEISLRTITDYVGTYSQFLVERDARARAPAAGQAASRTTRSRACARSSIASATRRRRPRRCRAGSRCSTRSCRSRCRRSASACTSRFRRARRADGWCSSCPDVHKAYGIERRLRTTSTCTSSAATASRSSRRTAPASPR